MRTQQFRLPFRPYTTVIPTGAAGFFFRADVWRAGRGVEGPWHARNRDAITQAKSCVGAALCVFQGAGFLSASALSFLLTQVPPSHPF